MDNFEFITPEKAFEINNKKPLDWWVKLAKSKPKKCQCGNYNIWKFGECGMCFTCVTGENDASDDYELIQL